MADQSDTLWLEYLLHSILRTQLLMTTGHVARCSIVTTVVIGEEDTMVNKIVVVDKIGHLGPPLR